MTDQVSDQPRTRYPVRVSVPGTRTDDNTDRALLATRETTGTWMIHYAPHGKAYHR